MSPSPGRSTAHAGVANQGLATLLVMIVVLAIIVLFCCFAAPGIRDICRKLCRCKIDDPEREPGMNFFIVFFSLIIDGFWLLLYLGINVIGSNNLKVDFWVLCNKSLLCWGKY